jgi:hypothetical protein
MQKFNEHIEKVGDSYRLLSHTGKNLGTFDSHAAAAKHEGEVEYFKAHESANSSPLNSKLTKASDPFTKKPDVRTLPKADMPPIKEDAIEDEPSMTAGKKEVTPKAAPAKGTPFPVKDKPKSMAGLNEDLSATELDQRILKALPRKNALSAEQIAEKISYSLPWGGPDFMDKLKLDVSYALARLADDGKVKRVTGVGKSKFMRADKLTESEHNVNASVVGLKPIKGKNQNFTYPDGLSYGGRSWTKEVSGAERWKDDKLDGMNYKDNYGNILRVVNEGVDGYVRILDECPNPFKAHNLDEGDPFDDSHGAVGGDTEDESFKIMTQPYGVTIAKGLSQQNAAIQASNYTNATGVKCVVLREEADDDDDDKPEVEKCIYCNEKPIDPKYDPYCSSQCGSNAQRDNQDD